MTRLLIACVFLGSCYHAAADEAEPASSTTRVVAKTKFVDVRQQKITTIEAEVIGTKGTPLKTELAGPNGRQLRLAMHDVVGSQPPKYIAQFRLVEVKKGRVQNVLDELTLAALVGRPARFVIGVEKGDRIEVDLTVEEIAAERE